MDSQPSGEVSVNDQPGSFEGSDDHSDYTNVGYTDDGYSFDTQAEICHLPKWSTSISKVIKPYLTSFTKFPDLPTEIRHLIWRLTLQPRTIELDYHREYGFISRAKIPVALKVCSDSRKAVATLYSLCFGSFFYNANIAFNFSLDTLFFNQPMQFRVAQFLAGLSGHEVKHIQSIAVDVEIGVDRYEYEDDCIGLLRLATSRMPALKEFLVVYNVGGDFHDQPMPEGNGCTELYETFTREWQRYMAYHDFHLDEHDEDDGYDCTMPSHDFSLELTKGFMVSVRSVWGWRPTELITE